MFQTTTKTQMARQTSPGTFSSGHMRGAMLAVFVYVLTPPTTPAQEAVHVLRGLLSDSEQVRKDAEKEIIKERTSTVAELVRMIRDEENRLQRPDSVDRAMRLLGELRATEGIDVLIEHMGFPILAEFGTPMGITGGGYLVGKSPAELFPAVNALIAIGEPSVGPILKRIAENDSVVERRAFVAVLRELEKRTAIREQFVREVTKSSGRPKERLQHALGWFDDPPKPAFP